VDHGSDQKFERHRNLTGECYAILFSGRADRELLPWRSNKRVDGCVVWPLLYPLREGSSIIFSQSSPAKLRQLSGKTVWVRVVNARDIAVENTKSADKKLAVRCLLFASRKWVIVLDRRQLRIYFTPPKYKDGELLRQLFIFRLPENLGFDNAFDNDLNTPFAFPWITVLDPRNSKRHRNPSRRSECYEIEILRVIWIVSCFLGA